MKDLLLTLLHLAVMTARLCGPGGVRAVIAEHFLLKQPLIEAATCTDLVSPIRQPRPLCCTIRASCNNAKQIGRHRWKKVSGHHRQGRVENTFFRYKSIIGDGLRARSPAGQGSEAVLGCEILNRMTALGRPVSYRIGR